MSFILGYKSYCVEAKNTNMLYGYSGEFVQLELSEQADDNGLDSAVFRIDRLEIIVGGFETDIVLFFVEFL